MNVLVINLVKATFNARSTNRYRLEEYSRLVDKMFVVVWTKEKEEPIVWQNKLFIYPTNSKFRLLYFLDSLRLAGKIRKKHGLDLVLTQDPFETGLAGWIIAGWFRLKLLMQIHTDFLSSYFWKESLLNKFRVFLAKILVRKAHSLQVVSERIKKSLLPITRYPLLVTTLPIFIDIKKIQVMPIKENLHQKYPQFDFIILMASRLSKEKNIDLAIRAMAEVVKKYPKAGLVIVGTGPERENYSLLITHYSLLNNVILENAIPFEQLISYYKTADLFLLTSNYEGYGMAVTEAMAAGCPVIMTDVGLAGEILENNKEGMVVPVGNKEKLVEAISNLIENKELREQLTDNALEKVKNFPTKEEYLANYKKLLEGCH